MEDGLQPEQNQAATPEVHADGGAQSENEQGASHATHEDDESIGSRSDSLPPSLRRLPLGRTISQSLAVFIKGLPGFILIGIIIYSPTLLFHYLEYPIRSYFYRYFSLLAQQLLSAVIIYGVFKKLYGEKASLVKCLSTGLSRIIPISLLVILLGSLGLFFVRAQKIFYFVGGDEFPEMLQSIVFFLTAIAVIMIYCALYVALPVMVVERKGLLQAIRRSQDLTRGSRWRIFLLMILLVMAGIVAQIVSTFLLQGLMDPETISFLGGALVFAKEVISGVVGAVFIAVVYYHLKMKVDGMSESELAAVFE